MASSGGRYVRETYCCVNGTHAEDYPSTWYAFDAGWRASTCWRPPGMTAISARPILMRTTMRRIGRPAVQYQWLEQDLRTHPSLLKFAVFHYPLYSDQSVEEADTYLRGPEPGGAVEPLRGEHRLYRPPHLPAQLPVAPYGLINYVTGGGGANLQPIGA